MNKTQLRKKPFLVSGLCHNQYNSNHSNDYIQKNSNMNRIIVTTIQVVTVFNAFVEGLLEEKKMAKYTQEIKDKAVAMAKSGIALKTIQSELGPNPKAVLRYLAKQGIDYKELKGELKEDGKLQGATKNQKTAKSNKAKSSGNAKFVKHEVEDDF